MCKKYTDEKVDQSAGLHRQIVTSLPITGDDKIIYMIRVSTNNENSDNYDEYLWVGDAYELIGHTKVDLTDYYNKSQTDNALNAKADKSLLYDDDVHFQFGVDSNGNYGYIKDGENTVTPFKTVGTRSGAITSNGTYTAKTDISKDGYESVSVNVPNSVQSKTVTAGTSNTTVTPDSGYIGMSSVTVQPTPSQTKSATPSTSAQTISPDSGKLLSSVSVGAISTQTKSASSSTSAQTIKPDSGKFLTSVSISAITPQRSLGTAATGSGIDSKGPYVYIPYGWWSEYSGKAGSTYAYLTNAQAVAVCPKQEKTVTSSRSAQTVTPDSGKLLSKVTVNALSPTGTYSATSRGASLDMGATSNYRYVNTNSVPNSNSGTYTPSSNGTALDMGATNSYRYVNTSTVYNLGYKAGWNAAKKWAVDNYLAKAPYSTGGSIYGATADMSSVWPYSERHFAAGLNLLGNGDLYLSVNSSKTAWEYDIQLTKSI